ncbi:MAG: class I SAM-dependent methyltransferase [Candidatus Paceibacterota bacterium]
MKLTEKQTKSRDLFIQKINSGVYDMQKNPCICGKNDDIAIASKDRYQIPINTVLCKNCALMRSDPYYTPKTLEEFYSNEYRELYGSNEISKESFFAEQQSFGMYIYDFLKENILKNEIQNKKIYEIGCGAGGILNFFKKNNNEVYGCDLGKNYIEYGITKGLKNLIVGTSKDLKQFGQADIIILNHVLEHLLDPIGELETIRTLLKEDGVLYIGVPGIYSIHSTYTDLESFLQNAHVYHFTLKTLTTLAEKVGFELIYGNETIQSAFKKNPSISSITKEKSIDVENYLRKIKRYKYIYKIKKISPKTIAINSIMKLAKKNEKAYNFGKKFYRKYILKEK